MRVSSVVRRAACKRDAHNPRPSALTAFFAPGLETSVPLPPYLDPVLPRGLPEGRPAGARVVLCRRGEEGRPAGRAGVRAAILGVVVGRRPSWLGKAELEDQEGEGIPCARSRFGFLCFAVDFSDRRGEVVLRLGLGTEETHRRCWLSHTVIRDARR